MDEEKLLKTAAIFSVVLMVCVVTFSMDSRAPKESISYASEVIITPVPTVELKPDMTKDEAAESAKDSLNSLQPDPVNKDIDLTNCNRRITIQKPSDLKKEYSVSLEDQAVDRKLVITISGLKSESIETEPITFPTDSVTSLEVTYTTTPDKDVTAIITLELVQTYGYLLREDENCFYIYCVDPHEIYDTIIVLDAGHGGYDSGTYSSDNEYLEKTMNLDILLRLNEYFINDKNIKVYTTRTSDRGLTLDQRVSLANDVNADLFLSVHCNANEDTSIHGTEVLYNEKQDDWDRFHSKQFAEICLEELINAVGRKNRGIVPRSRNVHIVGESNVPVALVEVGFMSNPGDMNFLKQENNRQRIAEGIYRGIMRSLEEKEK